LSRLQTRYDAGNHSAVNWLDGLEFYEFISKPDNYELERYQKKIKKRDEFFSFLKAEEQRYKDRTKLSKSIKNVSSRIRTLEKTYTGFLKTIARIGKREREAAIAGAFPIYDKKRIDLIKERDRLTTLLHLTKGF